MKRLSGLKKGLSLVLAVSLAVAYVPSSSSKAWAAPELQLNVKSAILIDAATGQVLYENNADEALPPASMAKMMTEYILMERIDSGKLSWDSMVTTSHYAANVGGSGGMLAENEQLSVKDMLYALSIYSSNDAAVALAEYMASNEQSFVALMNEKAKELGMSKTHFTSATGLTREDIEDPELKNNPLEGDTLMSARDASTLGLRLIKDHPSILEFTKIPSKKLRESDQFPMQNWNWMLEGKATTDFQKQFAYPGMDGLKTGSTDAAGYCFTGTAVRNGTRLISVVMNAQSTKKNPNKSEREAARFIETRKLLDYGFNNFETKTVVAKDSAVDTVPTVKVKKGLKNSVPVVVGDTVSLILPKDAKDSDIKKTAKDTTDGKLTAPVKKGQELGTMTVTYGKVTKTVKLVAAEDVKKAGAFRLFWRGVGDFFSRLGHTVKGWF
ncbi:D-alanyl-D-alanine carboxypeptidase family protein [Gorillibacterium sp. sgz500922]|uniref:D-alanyl-D-alanine carboxypeptidase family protein n=1 Tax=Gorillibacterium sp. sgz500922 TaxID=3446694 RepID=UPI003F663053